MLHQQVQKQEDHDFLIYSQVHMNKIKYWLLDSVVETRYPVLWLGSSTDDLEMMMNRDAHNATPKDIASELYELYQEGSLELCIMENYEERNGQELWTADKIERALHIDHNLYYGLTKQGGTKWEAITRPRWHEFLSIDVVFNEDHSVVAVNQQRIAQYLDIFTYLNPTEKIIPESIEWSRKEPFQATYWKILPLAFCVTFATTIENQQIHDLAWQKQACTLQKAWYEHTWYTKPGEFS